MPYRVVLYSPDRGQVYDGRTLDATGVGGGITARLSMLHALAAAGHDVTAYVNTAEPVTHAGVRYLPLARATGVDTDVFVAMSTGGDLSFAPLRDVRLRARLRLVWVQGVPKPADLDLVAADFVYVASNFLRRVCQERWGVPASRLFVCYNGLNQAAFEAVEAAPPRRDPFALAYIGSPEKGLATSLEVLRRLRARDDRFHLDVFGGARLWGRDGDVPTPEPGLVFHGLMGQAALVPRLYKYEYLLAPQAMEEGFGIAVQEAKRAGLIVVASDVGAFGELIRSSHDGYLVGEPHTSAACHDRMARLVLALSHDPARRARIRENAMRTPWSWTTAAAAWTAHWDRLLRPSDPDAGAATAGAASVLDLPDGRHDEASGEYVPAAYPASPMLDARGPTNRVLIAGYYGHGNLGDEAILHVLLEELRRLLPDLRATVVSGEPEATSETYDVQAVHERDVPALIDAAEAADLILVGGGGLFHDYQGVDEATLLSRWHWGLTLFAAFPVLATIFRKPLMLAAVGVGPLRSEAGRRYTRLAFDRADAATVRDAGSRALVGEIGADATRVEVTADPAFVLQAPSRREGRDALDRLGVPAGRPVVAVALRHWDVGVRSEAWQAHVAAALDQIVDAHDAVTVFLCFQARAEHGLGDDAVAERLRSVMRHGDRAVVAEPAFDACQVQALIAGADVVLGMRLHAVILAGNAGVPMVALAYDRKVTAVMERLGLAEYALDLGDVTAVAISACLERALREQDAISRQLAATHRGLRDAAAANAALAARLLAERDRPARPPSAELNDLLSLTYARQVKRAEVNDANVVRLTSDLAAQAREVGRAAKAAAAASAAANALRHEVAEIKVRLSEQARRLDDRTAEAERLRAERDAATADRARATSALATVTTRLMEQVRESVAVPAAEAPPAPPSVDPAVAELTAQVAYTEARFAEEARRAAVLEDQMGRVVQTKAWRFATWYWRRRAALAGLVRDPGAAVGRMARGIYHAAVPLGWRQALRRRTGRLLMNPYEYVFDRYRRERQATYGLHLAGVRAPGEPGLVSIVLPAYNGADLIREAVDSVLAQTYARFELIIVDDGSTDATGAIADEYARRDPRVTVVHQENRKLPRTLTEGVRRARGAFITWTSCDNRMKPDCLDRLVRDLSARPACDMVYANLDLIDAEGRSMRGAQEYNGYQRPPGSEHVHLPVTTSELNVWPNNSVGAAFLYRRRVAMLLGEYSPFRFVSEDYDYWMRVNALMTLRHTRFTEPVYDYRFHGASLSARWEELGMLRNRERLMVFEEFRRDFCLSPLLWIVDGDASDLAQAIERRVKQAGHLVYRRQFPLQQLPEAWVPVVHLRAASDPGAPGDPPPDLPPGALAVLATPASALPASVAERWDLCVTVGSRAALPDLTPFGRGWLGAADVDALFHAVDVRARASHLARLEALIERPRAPTLKATVVICTHRFGERVMTAIRSALTQTVPSETYEVLVVNNAPSRPELARALAGVRDLHRRDLPGHLRLVACPILGLSAARNAGIAEARGELVCLLDDDAVADERWLEHLYAAFDAHPDTGVIGGHIRLKIPAPRPSGLKPGWEKYWSQFVPGFGGYTEVRHWWEFPWGANWSARRAALLAIGGFRLRYGRVGDNFWGGEEVIAAALVQRLGYRIAILPQAWVLHDVEPARFTRAHVRRTLVAGHCVAYLGQRDLYIPMESGLGTTLKLLVGTYLDRSVPGRLDRLIDAAFRKYAQLRLLVLQLADLGRRARRPIVAVDPPGGG